MVLSRVAVYVYISQERETVTYPIMCQLNEKCRLWKNVLVVSMSFMFLFSSFGAVSGLQVCLQTYHIWKPIYRYSNFEHE